VTSASRLLTDGLSIVLIDLLLAGDNALVIAIAVRALPKEQRKLVIALGAGAAVVLRIGLTLIAAQLLKVEFIKLVGGAFVLWIAVKVFSDTHETEKPASMSSYLQAIWFIVFADITMSVDNVLAVAGASHYPAPGSVALIIFGLGLSIPFVVFSSNLLSYLMDSYPALMYVGAALLGKVGAEMMLTDGFIERTLHPAHWVVYVAEGIAIVGVLAASRFMSRRKT
jgi:YjbE family integral membrane protein